MSDSTLFPPETSATKDEKLGEQSGSAPRQLLTFDPVPAHVVQMLIMTEVISAEVPEDRGNFEILWEKSLSRGEHFDVPEEKKSREKTRV